MIRFKIKIEEARRLASFFFVGADGFEPPKSKDSRFTVCPIWPLWKTPFLRLSGCKGTKKK